MPRELDQVSSTAAMRTRRLRSSGDQPWPIDSAAVLACTLEASALKPGNVHPLAAFQDMSYVDFLAGAAVIAPIFHQAAALSVGRIVLSSTQAIRTRLEVNTILGTLLLLAPLAKAAVKQRSEPSRSLKECTREVLNELTSQDAIDVYEAIRLTAPGGLGQSDQHDVNASDTPPDLLHAMRAAPPHDTVARQYALAFKDILDGMLPLLRELTETYSDVRDAVVALQLQQLASEPDGLIVRKLGPEAGQTVMAMAAVALAGFRVDGVQSPAVQQFDQYLRADGNRRNPGTTADLVAAALFAYLIDNPAAAT